MNDTTVKDFIFAAFETLDAAPQDHLHLVTLQRYDHPASYGQHLILRRTALDAIPVMEHRTVGLFGFAQAMQNLERFTRSFAGHDSLQIFDHDNVVNGLDTARLRRYVRGCCIPLEWKNSEDSWLAPRILTTTGFVGHIHVRPRSA